MNEKRSPDDPARERTIAEQEEQEPENPGSAVGPMQTVVERVTQVGAPPTHHPLFDKFEPEHVTQFLTNAHDVDRNRVRFLSSNRWFHLVYTLIGGECLRLPDLASLARAGSDVFRDIEKPRDIRRRGGGRLRTRDVPGAAAGLAVGTGEYDGMTDSNTRPPTAETALVGARPRPGPHPRFRRPALELAFARADGPAQTGTAAEDR